MLLVLCIVVKIEISISKVLSTYGRLIPAREDDKFFASCAFTKPAILKVYTNNQTPRRKTTLSERRWEKPPLKHESHDRACLHDLALISPSRLIGVL
jgi:hypothetical protein